MAGAISIWAAVMLQIFKRHTSRVKQIWGATSDEEPIVQVNQAWDYQRRSSCGVIVNLCTVLYVMAYVGAIFGVLAWQFHLHPQSVFYTYSSLILVAVTWCLNSFFVDFQNAVGKSTGKTATFLHYGSWMKLEASRNQVLRVKIGFTMFYIHFLTQLLLLNFCILFSFFNPLVLVLQFTAASLGHKRRQHRVVQVGSMPRLLGKLEDGACLLRDSEKCKRNHFDADNSRISFSFPSSVVLPY